MLSVQALGIFPKYTRSDVDVWLWSCSGFFDWNEGIFSAYDAVDFYRGRAKENTLAGSFEVAEGRTPLRAL